MKEDLIDPFADLKGVFFTLMGREISEPFHVKHKTKVACLKNLWFFLLKVSSVRMVFQNSFSELLIWGLSTLFVFMLIKLKHAVIADTGSIDLVSKDLKIAKKGFNQRAKRLNRSQNLYKIYALRKIRRFQQILFLKLNKILL